MAHKAGKPESDDRRKRDVRPVIATCPVCKGRMEVVYARNNQQVSVCTDCHSGITIPPAAWEILRTKRDSK